MQTEKVRPDLSRAARHAMLRALGTHMADGVSWSGTGGRLLRLGDLARAGSMPKILLSRAVTTVKTAFVPGAAFSPTSPGQHFAA